jgi:membrane associated rhomboid family serine protease
MDLLDFLKNVQSYSENIFMIMSYVFILNVINWVFLGSILNLLGIYPRKLIGLPGILFAPVLHMNLMHYISNAFAFVFLSLMMIAVSGEANYYLFSCMISIVSGLFIWLFARGGLHIGASAVITGMYGWLICLTWYNPTLINALLLGVLFFYFGFILLGVLPAEKHVSWEGHLFGLISGAIVYHYPYKLLMIWNECKILSHKIELYFI